MACAASGHHRIIRDDPEHPAYEKRRTHGKQKPPDDYG